MYIMIRLSICLSFLGSPHFQGLQQIMVCVLAGTVDRSVHGLTWRNPPHVSQDLGACLIDFPAHDTAADVSIVVDHSHHETSLKDELEVCLRCR